MYYKCEESALFVQAVIELMLRVRRGSSKGMTERLCSEPTLIDYPDNDGLIYSGSASGNWFVEITLLKWGSRIHRARRNIIPFNEQPLHKQAGLRFFYSFFPDFRYCYGFKNNILSIFDFSKVNFSHHHLIINGLGVISHHTIPMYFWWNFLSLIYVINSLIVYTRSGCHVQATCVWAANC